jgi:hypothetical protein
MRLPAFRFLFICFYLFAIASGAKQSSSALPFRIAWSLRFSQ